MKKQEQLDINQAITNVQESIIKSINDSHLHPAIIQLILQNILGQVSQVAQMAPESPDSNKTP